jgi:hypothetical protein
MAPKGVAARMRALIHYRADLGFKIRGHKLGAVIVPHEDASRRRLR